jgi:phosphoenolpyruvate carboxykinase (GTP)
MVRFDPFAMLPFCGYNMADYFQHWLDVGRSGDPAKLPKLFWVNWFRRDGDGSFLWPGFGENIRVLKWVLERLDGTASVSETPIGNVPAQGQLDISGLDLDSATMAKLLAVDPGAWQQEVDLIRDHYAVFGDRLPAAMARQLSALQQRLKG